jgi:hypothetical protein
MISNREDIYKQLRSGKSILLLDNKDIKRIQAPIGKAIYKDSLERPIGRPRKNSEEKAKPNDRIICDICGGKFYRRHKSSHNKTKVHQAYESMNRKLSKVLLDNE